MSAATPRVIDETNSNRRLRLARLSRQAIFQIQDGDEVNISVPREIGRANRELETASFRNASVDLGQYHPAK